MRIFSVLLGFIIGIGCGSHASHDVEYYMNHREEALQIVTDFKKRYNNNPADVKQTKDEINAFAALNRLMLQSNKGIQYQSTEKSKAW